MRKFIPIILFTGISFTLTSQIKGIQFLNDTVFENVLSKAKAEHKIIFMDCYAVWCGPCKFMSANIFTDETVGNFHNTNFINLKYDMEKPYGMMIKKKYQVKGYPTFLYLDENGEVIHRSIGSTDDAISFLEISKAALGGEANYRTVCKKLSKGDRTAETISEYLRLNYRAANTDTLINEHFKLTSEDEKFSPETWNLYKENLNNPDSEAFQFFINHKQKYEAKFGKKAVDEKLLESMGVLYRSDPEQYSKMKSIDTVLFNKHQKMVKFSVANSKFLKDKTDREKWQELIVSASEYLTLEDISPEKLNQIAWTVYENYKTFRDKNSLKKAAEWSKRSISEEPENIAFLDTYAHIQYERGDKKSAVIYQERAVRFARENNNPDAADFEASLLKFKGKK